MSAPTPRPDERLVRKLVREATTAPSMYNAQPWRFRYRRTTRVLSLYADLGRAAQQADPSNRALYMGCGAALMNLRIAAEHAGWRTRTALLPDGHSPTLLADFLLEAPRSSPDGLHQLYPAIRQRHTGQDASTGTEIPAEVRAELVMAARKEGARLDILTQPHLRFAEELIREAEACLVQDADHEDERRSWSRNPAVGGTGDGIPEVPGGAPARDLPVLPTQPASGQPRPSAPALALLSTEHDSTADWLRAGQALERVLLTAARNGLSAAFADRALQWPDVRWLVRDPLSCPGPVQMMLRIGYGPAGVRTPRRPVRQVLTIEQ